MGFSVISHKTTFVLRSQVEGHLIAFASPPTQAI